MGNLLSRRWTRGWMTVATAGAAVFFVAAAADLDWLRLVAKPIPVLAMAASLLADAPGSPYRRWIVAGLGLGAVGDVLLQVDQFEAGLAAFLLGHAAYLPAFLADTRRPASASGLFFAAWAAGLVVSLRDGVGDLLVPVSLYGVVLAAVMWRATARRGVATVPADAAWLTLVGAILFGLSDSLIAIDRFGGGVPASTAAIMITYWAGQTGITVGAHRHLPNA